MSPHAAEIDKKLRAGISAADVARWLAEKGQTVTPQAVGRHAKDHLTLTLTKGRRPISTDFLEAVRDTAHQALEDGELPVTLKDGIAAQKALDARAARDLDRDIWAKVTLAITGNARRQLPPPDPAIEVIEGEFRELLTSGQ